MLADSAVDNRESEIEKHCTYVMEHRILENKTPGGLAWFAVGTERAILGQILPRMNLASTDKTGMHCCFRGSVGDRDSVEKDLEEVARFAGMLVIHVRCPAVHCGDETADHRRQQGKGDHGSVKETMRRHVALLRLRLPSS